MKEEKQRPAKYDLLLLAAILIAIHAVLLVYDYFHPDAFLEGDRSLVRMTLVENFSSAIANGKNIADVLVSQGIIGDYIIHAVAFIVGGKAGILILQIAASVLSACVLYLIALELTNSKKIAWMSAIIYATLPHSLAFPHMLVTETFANAFLILSVYEMLKYIQDGHSSASHITRSGIWIAISMLIRPIAVLLPLFIGLAIVISCADKRIAHSVRYLFVAYLPLLVWTSFMAITTGHFTTGSTGSTLGYNLFLKVERMHDRAPDDTAEPELLTRSEKSFSPFEFAQYVFNNPGRFANLMKFDISNLVLNSGINKLFGYYLNIYDISKQKGSRWLHIIDQHGLLRGVTDVLKQSPAFVCSTFAFTAYWVVLLAGSVRGFQLYIKDKSQPMLAKLILTGIPVYVLLFTLVVVSGPRSGHRSPFDFIICLMFSMFIYYRFPSRIEGKQPRIQKIT